MAKTKTMGFRFLCCILLLLQMMLLLLLCRAAPPAQETAALQAFIAATPHERQLHWNTSTPTCNWIGVTCNAGKSAVTELRLPGIGLVGPIPANTLGQLTSLRVLSLRSNGLTSPIPNDLYSLPVLQRLYLQRNAFTGKISPAVGNLRQLQWLVLSSNDFSGEIPFAVNNLTNLRSLLLNNNNLSGSLPSISIASLGAFNVSDNRLNGSIPVSLSHFPASSFAGNLNLCGPPLPSCTPFFPSPTPAPSAPSGPASGPVSKKKLSGAAIAGIAAGCVAFFLLLLLLLAVCLISRRKKERETKEKAVKERGVSVAAGETGMTSSSKEETGTSGALGAAAEGAERSRLVFIGKGAGYSFDLEDLLRASAEVLGKGSVGTSYKAVLEEGTTVVVKRLKDVAVTRREFDAHMEVLGRVEHRNLLPVRAYYYSKDEKLLAFDYLPNGSLSALLHGSRGSGRTPLDWDGRMRAALSAARGLAHLHAVHNLPHGNLKSSNLLLRPDPDAAALSEFALHPLFAPSSSRATAGGYRAPELIDTRRPTYKSDVYSLGVMLLELLTGKSPMQASVDGDGTVDLPRWVQSVVREEWTAEVFDVELVRLGGNAEEEMVALLQVAMACVSTVPDARPDATDVLRMIEEIGTGGGRVTESEEGVISGSEVERSKGTPPATTP